MHELRLHASCKNFKQALVDLSCYMIVVKQLPIYIPPAFPPNWLNTHGCHVYNLHIPELAWLNT